MSSRWKGWLLWAGLPALIAAAAALAFNIVLGRLIAPPEGAVTAQVASGGEEAPGDPQERGADRDAAPSRGRGASRGVALASYMDPIMARSLFDSSAVGATGEGIGGGAEGEERLSDLAYELILTSVAGDPAYSTALIRGTDKEARAQVYATGDQLDDATIVEIVRRRVYIERASGAVEYLELGAKKKTDKKPRKGSNKKGRTNYKDGITKVATHHYRVERDTLESALGDLTALSRTVTVRPKTVDGESGWELSRIRSTGPFKALGLRNRDVLVGVNGESISDPSKAMDMYGRLKTDSEVTLQVIRRGEKIDVRYDIY